MEFINFKSEIIQRAKNANACVEEFKRANKSESFEELFKVIGSNFIWCCNNKVIDVELLEGVGSDILNENKFFINSDTSEGYLLASGSATVRASGSATVRASGSATVRAWDSATVEAWDSATVEAWDSATVEASGSATVRASGSATVRASGSATVRASGSATVRASGSATVRAWDSATVRASGSATVRAWDSAYIDSRNTIEHKISDKVIMRYYFENRIVLSDKSMAVSFYEQ